VTDRRAKKRTAAGERSAVESGETPAIPARPARRGAMRDGTVLYGLVALGAVFGGVLRALASAGAVALFGTGFPWGTLFVNVVGSFLIGFYADMTGPDGRVLAGTRQRQFVMTGVCGGFTTFSVFSLETIRLIQSGDMTYAALNICVSVVAWLAAVWLGHQLAARFNRLGGF
jgi:fluoride exporter